MESERKQPFFRPLWRRVAVIALALGWSALEWSNGETFWGVLTLAISAYGIWALFIAYDPDAEDEAR